MARDDSASAPAVNRLDVEPASPYRRTPSNLTAQLAKLSLPDPEAVTAAARDRDRDRDRTTVDATLHGLRFESPEAVRRAANETDQIDLEAFRHDALGDAISDLDLPDPERMVRANLRADGARTPEMVCVDAWLPTCICA